MLRRDWIKGVALTSAAPLVLPSRNALGYAANEQLRLAVVGMAGFGAWHGFSELLHTLGNVGYAVSCDVDLRKVQKVYDLWQQRATEWANSDNADQRRAASEVFGPLAQKKPPLYADFRRMFDEAGKQFDAVVVATPDHTHAIIAAAALRAGKPVLAEKPLTIAACDARALMKLVKERPHLATQMNNGGAAQAGFRRGVEVVEDGLLGDVREVHVFFSRGGRNFQEPPQGSEECPKELNWDCWLAQLKWRPYHSGWINRIAWRESSIGELGNFGPHSSNMAFMGLHVKDLWEGPEGGGVRIRVQAECSEANQLSYPRWERIRWDVPARGARPPVAFTWHHGWPPDYAPGSRQMLEGLLRDRGATDADVEALLKYAGCIIVGGKGLLATNSHNTEIRLFPKEKFAGIEQKKPLRLPLSSGHYREWVDACRGQGSTISTFAYAAPFAEFLNVGSIATRFPGEMLEFDPVGGQITNHPRAAGFLQYEYRKGWTI